MSVTIGTRQARGPFNGLTARVQLDPQTVLSENLDQVTAATAEDMQIPGKVIAPQVLLNLKRQC